MRYNYKVEYKPGKELIVADALSRNFSQNEVSPVDEELAQETEAHVNLVVSSVQVKPYFIEEIKSEQRWPDRNLLDDEILPYYTYRHEISFSQGLLLRGSRIIIPMSLQLRCLQYLHQGHMGIVKCRQRAKTSIWWLGLSTQIEHLCVEHRENPKEKFLKDNFPERPWQKVAIDLFKTDKWYLISFRVINESEIKNSFADYTTKLNTSVDTTSILEKERRAKEKSAMQFNKRHRTKELSLLKVNDSVWVTDLRVYGKIIQILSEPRSYLVETVRGVYRRNRWHLIPAPYHVPNFTPTLPANEIFKEIDKSVESNPNCTENIQDCDSGENPNSESVSDKSPTSEKVGGLPNSIINENKRPVRDRKQPSHFNDYVMY
ncbi:hypothetical protein NQ318_004646 [Aromia moschata]|uniref:RNA-directed DNA polymerase n=1 Tax=Aromia moschata TaxID=1265417 RepID=A0AAV8Y526_9CUCU|nr:hypothetical protein NQ318_004646 [Aromia moschata]